MIVRTGRLNGVAFRLPRLQPVCVLVAFVKQMVTPVVKIPW